MIKMAGGVMEDARTLAREMLANGECVASYPPGKRPMFHLTTDPSLLDLAMGSFDIDGVEVYLGFLRNSIER